MAKNDKYVTGKGMMGGPGGTYGRYSVSQNASNLSRQFEGASNVEERQRSRFNRKHESGFVGNGFWFGMYPNMVGALTSGTNVMPEREKDQDQPMNGASASATDGMGVGGTGAGFVGGLGS
jgi:hypothetical protein